jgi:hypothetical protein
MVARANIITYYGIVGRMNTYSVKARSEDRSKGSEGKTVKVDASSIAGAVAKAEREFVKGLDSRRMPRDKQNGK